jgi:hypothetical protein
MTSSVDLELLAKRELDEGLISAATEESEDASEYRNRERCRGPHRAADSAVILKAIEA